MNNSDFDILHQTILQRLSTEEKRELEIAQKLMQETTQVQTVLFTDKETELFVENWMWTIKNTFRKFLDDAFQSIRSLGDI